MKRLNEISKYKLLKTFIKGEHIRYDIDDFSYESTFVRVTNTSMFILDGEEEKEIELNRITKIIL